MKKLYLFAVMVFVAMQVKAQNDIANLDTYIGAQLTTEDLNGTARYVGMGGAMEALGADISTIGSNPAGLGLFRSNQVSGSFGLVMQSDAKSFNNGSKTNASFDQLGIVLATRSGMHSYLNFGFNYHKNRNFNQILQAIDQSIDGSSQNRQTTIKAIRGDLDTKYGESQVDYLLYSFLIGGPDDVIYTYDSKDYRFNRAQTGYIGEFDFNLSTNLNNRVYLGLTIGLKDVHYNSYTEYNETLESFDTDQFPITMKDDHRITGEGFDFKAGVIVRPVEESPFRIGVSVASPTFYKLTTNNHTVVDDQYGWVGYDDAETDFRFYTPWKFGISVGHTVGNYLALGASYEYTDYSTNDMRIITSKSYNYWDGFYYEHSKSDPVMKRHAENTLRGVSLLKLGAEYKPAPNMSVRLGYNYVSPMYKEDGVRDQTLDSPGTYMASTTDYTNWKDTHRLTAGIGYSIDNFRIDLAYQYSMRKGDFYPYMHRDPDHAGQPFSAQYIDFDTGELSTLANQCRPVNVKDNRHQLLCTMTYSF